MSEDPPKGILVIYLGPQAIISLQISLQDPHATSFCLES